MTLFDLKIGDCFRFSYDAEDEPCLHIVLDKFSCRAVIQDQFGHKTDSWDQHIIVPVSIDDFIWAET